MMAALGLGNGQAGLRYGRLLIFTDANHDGAHIKGLVITNFYKHHWNFLCAHPCFLGDIVTPILKAHHVDCDDDTRWFFTNASFKR